MMIPVVAGLFLGLSVWLQPPTEFLKGYWRIVTSSSILLTDYVAVGGIGPALFNSGSLMLFCYWIGKRLGMDVTGSLFAGVLTVGGFAFFGKNLLNVSLVLVGMVLYTRYKDIRLRSVWVVFLFATGLAPISSLMMFGLGLPYLYSIPLGITMGILSGFLLVELSFHTMNFHKGYNLYNIGFACGVLTLVYFSILQMIGLTYESSLLYTNESNQWLAGLFVVVCLLYLVVGGVFAKSTTRPLSRILQKSGRAVSDFTRNDQQAATMINIGLIGLLSFGLVRLIGLGINGPTMGGLMTIVGFGAFGKHVRNVLPPMLGVVLVVFVLDMELSIGIALAILFSTALAPIAGEHGILAGLIAGALHLPITIGLAPIHGGILLYANGFAAGFTAVVMDTCILSWKRRKSHGTT
jgi:hypothetical protein